MPEVKGTPFVGSRETGSGTATFLVCKAGSVLLNGVPTAAALPEERRDANPRSLLRLPDGRPSRDPV